MKIKNKNGFFLSETLIVIAVVAVVLVSVFGLFASVYSNFKETEKYNTTNAINAIASINNYVSSKESIDTSVLLTGEPVLDITNDAKLNDEIFSEMKKEFEVKKLYLINMSELLSNNNINNYSVDLRKYLKTLSNVRGIIMLLVNENNEYSYVQISSSDPGVCAFNGELVQGAEYVKGQYTYRYKQEYKKISSTERDWANMETDGWGVILTDKTSTDPVTSKICSTINGSPVVSMSYLYFDSQATSIDLSSFDTSRVINMSNMFAWTKATKLDISKFDTSNVTNMEDMFSKSDVTMIKGLNNLNTSNVTNMSGMFYQSKLEYLDLSSFDISSTTNVDKMFLQAQTTLGYSKSKQENIRLNGSGSKPQTLMFITNPEVVFDLKGNTVFAGMSNIDTNIRLFDASNASKDFEISFNIVSYDSAQTQYSTILNAKDESGSPYYGLMVRFENASQIIISANATTTEIKSVTLSPYTGTLRIIKSNDKIYYKINDGNYIELADFSSFINYFNTPITFGSSLNGSLQSFRYFNGTLSNIIVRLEK